LLILAIELIVITKVLAVSESALVILDGKELFVTNPIVLILFPIAIIEEVVTRMEPIPLAIATLDTLEALANLMIAAP